MTVLQGINVITTNIQTRYKQKTNKIDFTKKVKKYCQPANAFNAF